MSQYHSRNALWFRVARHDAWINQRKRCAYCFCELTEDKVTGDHVTAQSKGGTIDNNIVAACRDCNRAKQSIGPRAFKRLLTTEHGMEDLTPEHALYVKVCASRRRINLAADRACKRIRASVGLA